MNAEEKLILAENLVSNASRALDIKEGADWQDACWANEVNANTLYLAESIKNRVYMEYLADRENAQWKNP